LPNLLFSEVLPHVESLAELKVTLHVIWAVHQKKGFPRFVTLRELSRDGTLMAGLKGGGRAAEEVLGEGLALAVARGTLLHLTAELGGSVQELYFLNTAEGRQAVAKLRSGEIELGQVVLEGDEKAAVPDQPSIFALYEQNVGLLTPLIAEELKEAEKVYPAGWIEDAFKQAVVYNKRSWHYIRRILERWAVEGRGSNEEAWGGNRRLTERPARYTRWRRVPGK
jgi:DnaD/phage-associated family protein